MSLINNTPRHVKFISYTGKYPNLCSGVLTLEIDGVTYCFGHDYSKYRSWENDGNYEAFWSSGGGCGFYNDYANAYVDSGAWVIDVSAIRAIYDKVRVRQTHRSRYRKRCSSFLE